MDDVYHRENFLSKEDFLKLNQTMLSRYKRVLNMDKLQRFHTNEVVATRENASTPEDIAVILGPHINKVVGLIRDTIISEFGLINPKLGSAWYLYMGHEKQVGLHVDGAISRIPGSTPEKCYSFGIYAHTEWEDTWGGEWQTEHEKYTVRPNTLLGWKRSVPHSVAPITHGDPDRLRLLLVTSWSVE